MVNKKADDIPEWCLVRTTDLCEYMKVSRTTVGLWAKELGFTKRGRGLYDLRSVLAGMATRMKAQAREDTSSSKERKETAEADIKEMERDKLRGELVYKDKATRSVALHYREAASIMDNTVPKVVQLVPENKAEVERLVQEQMDRAKETISRIRIAADRIDKP